jgi:GntR family carbon starvation induced transcriptional regulator
MKKQTKVSEVTISMEPATLATAVYLRLREDILRGVLPPETKLRLELMRERYDASPSPVREALNRLSSEGLVAQHDQRGFYVSSVSLIELRELVKTRCWVEELALRETISVGDSAWEEGVLVALHRLLRAPRYVSGAVEIANPKWEELHRRFHEQLISQCGSRSLLRFCAELRDQIDRYRHIAAAILGKLEVNLEHEAIGSAVLKRDVERAVELLTNHYRQALGIIERRAPKDLFSAG